MTKEFDPSKTKFRFPHMDAGDNFFMSRQLEQIRAQTFQIAYPELQGRSLVPVNHEIDPGAETYKIQVYDITGDVEVTSDYSTKGPR